MAEKAIERFTVNYLQVLDEDGNVDEKLMPKLSVNDTKKMYELMVLTRVFDDRAVKYQRQGRMGTYASVFGQEACQVGSALAMSKEDMAFPSFREHGVFITRGMPLDLLFLFWIGDERGMQIPKNINMFPVCIPVGTHLPHAVGSAFAFKYKNEKRASVVYFGDGATSKGDFHEAMNFAGVFNVPCVFICQNNQYAISVPVNEQTASSTLAQKAIAYGFGGIKVDGNDVFGVYRAVKEALEKARTGKGPTFIELFTYRRGDHTTADDAKKYRSLKEMREWEKRDPILRLKRYMTRDKIFSNEYEKGVLARSERLIDVAFKKAESVKRINSGEIFDYMFASLTPELQEQKKSLEGGE